MRLGVRSRTAALVFDEFNRIICCKGIHVAGILHCSLIKISAADTLGRITPRDVTRRGVALGPGVALGLRPEGHGRQAWPRGSSQTGLSPQPGSGASDSRV
jgi:hypothetical protein